MVYFFLLRSVLSSETNVYFSPDQFLASLFNSPHVHVLPYLMVDFSQLLCGNFTVLGQVGTVCNFKSL